MTTRNVTRIDTAEVAKLIRKELKASFPGYKFSVRSDRYSGGSSIDVKWTNGPTESQVKEKIGHFHGATFDGMQDLKEYHVSQHNGQPVRFGNDFLFLNREYTDDVLENAANWYLNTYGNPAPTEFVPAKDNGKYKTSAYIKCDYRTQRIIYRHIGETTF